MNKCELDECWEAVGMLVPASNVMDWLNLSYRQLNLLDEFKKKYGQHRYYCWLRIMASRRAFEVPDGQV
jgi:hypothetical protein